MRLTKNSAGQTVTAPIMTKAEALGEIAAVFDRAGYAEGQGDLWLGNTLDRLSKFIDERCNVKDCEHADFIENQDGDAQCRDCGLKATGAERYPEECPACTETVWKDGTCGCTPHDLSPQSIADVVKRASSNITQDGHILKVSK